MDLVKAGKTEGRYTFIFKLSKKKKSSRDNHDKCQIFISFKFKDLFCSKVKVVETSLNYFFIFIFIKINI